MSMPHAAAPMAAAAHAPSGFWSTRLVVVLVSHTIIDFFSMIVVPLLSVLEGRLALTPTQGAILVATGSMTSGLIQPAVALHGDKHDTRWLGTLGFVIGVVCLSLIGWAHNFAQAMALVAVGAAGVGAFHPPATAISGHLAGARRSRALAFFFTAGMIGGVAGAALIPKYVKAMEGRALSLDGVQALALWIPVGLIAAIVLAWAAHGAPHKHAHAAREHAELPIEERRKRWRAVWVLYAGNALRFIVNMAMVQVLVRWSELHAMKLAGEGGLTPATRQAASVVNGQLQSGMALGMGVGGLFLGMLTPRRFAMPMLVLVPAIGAIAVAALPHAGEVPWAFLIAAAVGIGYFGVMPTTVGIAQRLLPHRTSLASGLLMGGAWSLAAAGPPLAQFLMNNLGMHGAGLAIAAMLLASGLVTLLMPRGTA